MRDIARDIRGAAASRLERRLLAIHRSYLDALFVGEHGAIDRPREMIQRELGFAANIDQGIELR